MLDASRIGAKHMARAQFHKNQRVYVKPVGTWTRVDRVVPQWTKGLEEPIRIHYDVGMGREFSADELQSESTFEGRAGDDVEEWRIVRARNKWQSDEETAQHPYPGTYPIVITGEADWGGWRVPGAEYALSPARIERQARMMTCAPQLTALFKQVNDWARKSPEEVPGPLGEILLKSQEVLTYLEELIE
jgi:hypothetical protein